MNKSSAFSFLWGSFWIGWLDVLFDENFVKAGNQENSAGDADVQKVWGVTSFHDPSEDNDDSGQVGNPEGESFVSGIFLRLREYRGNSAQVLNDNQQSDKDSWIRQ